MYKPYISSSSYSPPASPYTQDTRNVIQYSIESIPSETASALKRQQEGPILWFANPPMNIAPLDNIPVHSVAYLKWKEEQQRKQLG